MASDELGRAPDIIHAPIGIRALAGGHVHAIIASLAHRP